MPSGAVLFDNAGNKLKVVDNGDGTSSLATREDAPAAANILNGYLSSSASAGAATLVTVPAGRTWTGVIGANCRCTEAAAGTVLAQAVATFTTAGANVTPAAGTYLLVGAWAGQNLAGGTVGTQGNNFGAVPLTVVAPAGNAVTIQVATTNAGTFTTVDAFAIGRLI